MLRYISGIWSRRSQKPRKNILLGVTGSVAATLTPKMVLALLEYGDVKVILTRKASLFKQVKDISPDAEVFPDDEDFSWEKKGDSIQHIDLVKWADIFIIAPLSANTLAKISNGFADGLLTNTARAWNYEKKMILAPAMNTEMYKSMLTGKHLTQMEKLGAEIVSPVKKTLACGDTGIGAMANIPDILKKI